MKNIDNQNLNVTPDKTINLKSSPSATTVKKKKNGNENFLRNNQKTSKKRGGNNPPHSPHPPLSTCTERVQAAIGSGCRNEDSIVRWCSEKNLSLSRAECRRVLKKIAEQVA